MSIRDASVPEEKLNLLLHFTDVSSVISLCVVPTHKQTNVFFMSLIKFNNVFQSPK
jgi:uncharacterized protein (DUF362 family)